jgi:protein-disulfide isomerase
MPDRHTLTFPVGPRDHRQGPDDAPLTLVEYGDYECPSCGRAFPFVKEVRRHFGPRLRFVFRNFPLADSHPHALAAAEAAECAAAQGRFWEMHDQLFEHQRALGTVQLVGYARAIGADVARFERDLADHAHRPRVQEDFDSGVHSGVRGTPTFYVNGVRHDGSWDAAGLIDALERAAPRPA